MLAKEDAEIFRTAHWVVRHSVEAAIPGYIVLHSLDSVTSLGALPQTSSQELGALLQCAVGAVEKVVTPERVYVCLFNETGSAVHFHVFPRMTWMREFSPDANNPRSLVDGGIVFSAARRAKADPDTIRQMEPQILEAVTRIRRLMSDAMRSCSNSRL